MTSDYIKKNSKTVTKIDLSIVTRSQENQIFLSKQENTLHALARTYFS